MKKLILCICLMLTLSSLSYSKRVKLSDGNIVDTTYIESVEQYQDQYGKVTWSIKYKGSRSLQEVSERDAKLLRKEMYQ